jgi:CRISPR-associated endonuclease Cas1
MTSISALNDILDSSRVCELRLLPTNLSPRQNAHPLSIFEAIVKGITELAGLNDTICPLYAWPMKRALNMQIQPGQVIPLKVGLYGGDLGGVNLWIETARHYFEPGQPGRNFRLADMAISSPLLNTDMDAHGSANELCLDFFTPFPFQTTAGKPRFWLDSQGFAKALALRIKKLFGFAVTLPAPEFQLLPYYWSYCQIPHDSHSQPGHTKYLNGCVGKLYLKGSEEVLSAWRPWLLLAEQIGIGGQLSFGLGRFQLLPDSPAYFQATLTNPAALEKAIKEILEEYDDALPALSTNPAGVDETTLARKFADSLKNDWLPEPYQAFRMLKPHGGFRIVEKAPFHDRTVQRHILALLEPVLDRTFEEESIGYRKGLSREVAVKRLSRALGEGYDYVVESDIADFFPSVDLALLESQLDKLLPIKDALLRRILNAILHTPRELDGFLERRTQGLAMGSPLSPLLANLYLNVFDERIKTHGVRLIRFADDFVILTKGRETADALLGVAESSLKDLGLRLNLEKTAIKPIAEGFTFLGIRFGGDGNSAKTDSEHPDTLRKPVYVTEPYVFLGVAEDTLEIRRANALLAHIPLRRISEILTLGPCVWSSQLAARAAALDVPMVLTTGNAKHVATIENKGANHYDTAYRHAAKFHAMSDSQRLSVAKAFAAGKLHNYMSLIMQRYRTGDNQLLAELKGISEEMWAAPDNNVLRGLEGLAARKSFARITGWIKSPDFIWQGRKRRPPDRLNSMLNFGYHLLFCRINVLVRGEGLNPYLGFLHEPNDRYESLVCDIQELFRPHIDRLVIRLLNLSMIDRDDFEQNEKGFWLARESKKKFLSEFSRELDQPSLLPNKATLNESLVLQVHSIKHFFLKDSDIQVFKWGSHDVH